jgi:hypothetical protein
MKRILFLTTHPALGGAQKWTYDQIRLLDGQFKIFLASGSLGWLVKNAQPYCEKTLVDKRLYR